jgi:FKBP-type peptidyl-prolyl cis-trans isomerase (trigger factor)
VNQNIKHKIETISTCEKRITVAIAAEELSKERQAQVQNLAGATSINGFRKGTRWTKEFVAKHHQADIEKRVYETLVNRSFKSLLEEEHLNPISEPVFSRVDVNSGILEYIVDFEVNPAIPPPQLGEATIEKFEVNINEAEIDQVLAQLYPQSAVQSNQATVDAGNTSTENTVLTTGTQETSKESDFLKELREPVRQLMEVNLKKAQQVQLRRQVLDLLLERNPISDLPKQLLERHYQRLVADKPVNTEKKEDSAQQELHLRQTAHRQVTAKILLEKYAKEHNIQLDSERVTEKMKEIASSFQGNQKSLKDFLQNKQIVSVVCAQTFEEQVLNHLVEQANCQVKPSTYTQVMGVKSVKQEDSKA